jgi:ketosteroid isomerase-like protein
MSRLYFSCLLLLAFATIALAQNSNSSTTTNVRPRTTTTPAPKAQAKPTTTPAKPAATPSKPATGPAKPAGPATPATDSVAMAFDKIIEGIRKANVDLATNGYWNSPALVLFNYNGTVTKGWEQMRKNRESSYREMKDVKLEIRDKHIFMLGRDGAVVTCLWSQSQTYKGEPDTASGRMTLVFKHVGTAWKAVHLHTSPDRPDPSRVPASEQSPAPATKP